jgi:hypothetical protein
MSDPNCRRRVSECIFFDALSRPPATLPLPLLELPSAAPPEAGPGEAGDRMADALLSVRLSTGERGISCSWGSVCRCQYVMSIVLSGVEFFRKSPVSGRHVLRDG